MSEIQIDHEAAKKLAHWFCDREIRDFSSDYLAEQGEEVAEAYLDLARQLTAERARVTALAELVEQLERGALSELMDEEEVAEFWERCAIKKQLAAIMEGRDNG